MAEREVGTAMAREIAEIPGLAENLLAREGTTAALAEKIDRFRPRMAIVCGRGSSGHVCTFLKYLFEVRLGLVTSTAAPSVITAYNARPDMRGAFFVVVSQSGRSPDLVATTALARSCGALTLAIVNDARSPLAAAAELVVSIEAGPEKSVVATKSFVLSMLASAHIAAKLAHDRALIEALGRMPARLTAALACDWSRWAGALADAPAGFIAARGIALASAREIALKVIESLRMPMLAFSAAELRHGPRAAVTSQTPILVLRQNDEASQSVDALTRDIAAASTNIFIAGGPAGTLPWIGDDHPVCDCVSMLVPAYRAIEAAVRKRGLDPDCPPHLAKVTCTL